ncbi:MAG: HAMP domain-containing histidine kinase [Prolixibacteraceae bacterium]|jgi:signal transduction histidine kinase|nr:HAMP domain-containing histidine kinase [Prolixibacteraceae bacterium]MBT6006471.1 HAMP domain-containing histidine kinase [Prolixibacteraceae bacterium]MBT6767071.1 HAMP domain-containing histidine kinase [Prolixibacteraceae bacterium]MBT6997430.1 HAMP domain-containing histidine kinase [Prolixibacteraceae bacterium]MBT7396641.1 HAMP domain-containing histidine kinase [Prolixibacteraceae bacterium]
MNQKLKPASRLTIIFILAVVISGSILTWFSINSISNLKELTERRVTEEQRELAAKFSLVMQNKIETVTGGFKNEISPPGLLKDSLIKTTSENNFITLPFILKNNGSFLYPNFMGLSENMTLPKFSSRYISAFKNGEENEFARNNLKTAKKHYLSCLSFSKNANDSVKALNALGRVSVKLKEPEIAIGYYKHIVLDYFNISGSDGLLYVYYAIPQLVKISNSDNCDEILVLFEFCLEKMETGFIPLNFGTKELLALVIKWTQENSFISTEKLAHVNKLEQKINKQLQFIDEYKNSMLELMKKESPDNYLNVNNDFRVINSYSGNSQKLLLVNTNLENPVGFLIDGIKLFDSVLNQGLQSVFEFDYKIEFLPGYPSNANEKSLIYTAQMNPYFPGQMMQIKLNDENLINDFIKRRSWIYGIATALLLVALSLGVALIVRDIAREKQIARLQSDFISNVTHELKTPLTSIYMFAESLLLKRVKKETDKDEYLSIILKESERLKRMINNILEFSKMEKGKPEYHFVSSNLASIINASIHQFDYWFEKENFEVLAEMDENIFAEVDPEKMKQAISNLLSNALKYSTITKKIFIRLFKTSNNIHIEVEDQGIGIPENQLSQIFEKFYRVDQKENISGTGLGLTVVKEIIEAHKGKISVESKLGGGSKFSITLNRQTEKV